MQELNNQNITRIPITVDGFGSMGLMGISYYYNSDKVSTITDKKILSRLPKPALEAYQKAKAITQMRTLFKASNKGYKLINKDKWFGSASTYDPINLGKALLKNESNHIHHKPHQKMIQYY